MKLKATKKHTDPLAPLWNVLKLPAPDHKPFKNAVLDLHEALTSRRSSELNRYMSQASHRYAYKAYYMPLNILKFLNVFEKHPIALHQGWIDFGSGPGTASLAALLYLNKTRTTRPITSTLKIVLYDRQRTILEDAENIVKKLAESIDLPVDVEPLNHLGALKNQSCPTILLGNVLNELKNFSFLDNSLNLRCLKNFLFLEPSHRASSQRLISLREQVLNKSILSSVKNLLPLGPCVHSGCCPLANSKHWCHFSEPLESDTLRRMNLAIFKNPRLWIKFSYLLLSDTQDSTGKAHGSNWHRIIGDPHPSGPTHRAVDLCQPNTKRVLRLKREIMNQWEKKGLVRGALIRVSSSNHVQAVFPTSLKKNLRGKRE